MQAIRVLLHPRMWALHVAGVAAIVVTILLGLWQYGVWGGHRAAVEQDLQNATPVPLAQLVGESRQLTTDQVGAPVTLTGTWMTDATFFVSGQQHDGRAGYWLVTPMAWNSQPDHATLVVIGFVPSPSGTGPAGSATVTGWIQPSDTRPVIDTDPTDDVLPALSTASAAQRLAETLSPGYVVMESSVPSVVATLIAPESLPKLSAATSIRNLFYAFQWWTFGAFAAFMWWRWSADAVIAAREAPVDLEPAPESVSEPETPV